METWSWDATWGHGAGMWHGGHRAGTGTWQGDMEMGCGMGTWNEDGNTTREHEAGTCMGAESRDRGMERGPEAKAGIWTWDMAWGHRSGTGTWNGDIELGQGAGLPGGRDMGGPCAGEAWVGHCSTLQRGQESLLPLGGRLPAHTSMCAHTHVQTHAPTTLCTYVHTHTHTHACTQLYVHKSTHAYMHTHAYTDIDACTYTRMHTHTCTYACTSICTHTCSHARCLQDPPPPHTHPPTPSRDHPHTFALCTPPARGPHALYLQTAAGSTSRAAQTLRCTQPRVAHTLLPACKHRRVHRHACTCAHTWKPMAPQWMGTGVCAWGHRDRHRCAHTHTQAHACMSVRVHTERQTCRNMSTCAHVCIHMCVHPTPRTTKLFPPRDTPTHTVWG